MRLLLDTHIALWAVSSPETLPGGWARQIGDPDNMAAVSIASLWEIAVKRPLQRGSAWDIKVGAEEAVALFREASFAIVPIEIQHLAEVEALAPHHRDPFDRLMVATARADGYRLVTHDRTLGAYGDHVLVI